MFHFKARVNIGSKGIFVPFMAMQVTHCRSFLLSNSDVYNRSEEFDLLNFVYIEFSHHSAEKSWAWQSEGPPAVLLGAGCSFQAAHVVNGTQWPLPNCLCAKHANTLVRSHLPCVRRSLLRITKQVSISVSPPFLLTSCLWPLGARGERSP